MKLKNLLMPKIFFKNLVVILRILVHNQVLILKWQFLFLDMLITHIWHLNILVLWILLSKTSIKFIRRHGGQSKWQLMNLILDRLKYFLNFLLSTFKSIQMSHKHFSEIKKNIEIKYLEEILYAQVVMIHLQKIVQKGEMGEMIKTHTCFKDSMKDQSIGLILILSG